jgi:hypothetical protein
MFHCNSSKPVDKNEILRTVSNACIYCSSDKLDTAYLVQYFSENSIFNINTLCSSCEDMACCSSECIFAFLYAVYIIHSSISETGRNRTHVYIYTFLLRMTDTVTSQNTDFSSCDIPLQVTEVPSIAIQNRTQRRRTLRITTHNAELF